MAVQKFAVAEYHRLIQSGRLQSGGPVELLEGYIVIKPRRSPRHNATLEHAGDGIRAALPAEWHLRINSAITTMDSEPEPDMAVVLGPARCYAGHHPGPTEIGLIAEVSDASRAADRVARGRVYARAGITNYWIVNIVDRQVEVYAGPDPQIVEPRFTERTDFSPGDSVPLILGGREVARLPVTELLP